VVHEGRQHGRGAAVHAGALHVMRVLLQDAPAAPLVAVLPAVGHAAARYLWLVLQRPEGVAAAVRAHADVVSVRTRIQTC